MTPPTLSEEFAPYREIAAELLPHAFDKPDPAHDIWHLVRVWKNASSLARIEGGDTRILLAAVILHDCINVPKTSPNRALASRFSAMMAAKVLEDLRWAPDDIRRVEHAIAARSFSAGIPPETIEAKILQDADRLDAIGAIGIARFMSITGLRDRPLYDPVDPAGSFRPLNDLAWTIDHFPMKLMTLEDRMNTETGRKAAKIRSTRIKAFYEDLIEELTQPLEI